MTENLQLIFQIIQWVGSLFVLIGGIILIVRFFKERPIIKIDKFFSHHYVGEHEESTVFHMSLNIDNVGDKPTTIKDIFFFLSDKKGEKTSFIFGFEDFKMSHLSPRSSIEFSEERIISGSFEEDIEILVIIEHTQGHLNRKTESIFCPIVFNNENNDYDENY